MKKWQPINAMAHDKPYQRTGQSINGIVNKLGFGSQTINNDCIGCKYTQLKNIPNLIQSQEAIFLKQPFTRKQTLYIRKKISYSYENNNL